MKRILAVAITAWLAGCALTGERPANRYYLLEPAPAATPARGTAITATPTSASGFYDTQDIVFSRAPGTRGYYQFSHWTERPQRAMHAALAARLATAREDYALATHVVEIYHDAAQAPGVSRITVAAELTQGARRVPVARRTFTREAPAASHDAAGAVAGFNAAAGRVVDDVVEWAGREVAARNAEVPEPETTGAERDSGRK